MSQNTEKHLLYNPSRGAFQWKEHPTTWPRGRERQKRAAIAEQHQAFAQLRGSGDQHVALLSEEEIDQHREQFETCRALLLEIEGFAAENDWFVVPAEMAAHYYAVWHYEDWDPMSIYAVGDEAENDENMGPEERSKGQVDTAFLDVSSSRTFRRFHGLFDGTSSSMGPAKYYYGYSSSGRSRSRRASSSSNRLRDFLLGPRGARSSLVYNR